MVKIPSFYTDTEKKDELKKAIAAQNEREQRFDAYVERKMNELSEREAKLERRDKGQVKQHKSQPAVVKRSLPAPSSVAVGDSASQSGQLPAKRGRGRPRKVARSEAASAPKVTAPKETKSRKGGVKKSKAKKEKPAGTRKSKKRETPTEQITVDKASMKKLNKSKFPATSAASAPKATTLKETKSRKGGDGEKE